MNIKSPVLYRCVSATNAQSIKNRFYGKRAKLLWGPEEKVWNYCISGHKFEEVTVYLNNLSEINKRNWLFKTDKIITEAIIDYKYKITPLPINYNSIFLKRETQSNKAQKKCNKLFVSPLCGNNWIFWETNFYYSSSASFVYTIQYIQ